MGMLKWNEVIFVISLNHKLENKEYKEYVRDVAQNISLI
jgi:hypothetical protein